MVHYLHESQRCNIRNPMPEGRQRRCPNVINIFRARRVEKDSLPPPFLHPPRLVLFSPSPNFLADAPSAEGPPQIFNLHFSFPLLLPSTYSHCLPLHQPSLSSPPSLSLSSLSLSLPSLRRGPRLNSQRPHREESVNATGKRERENVELSRARTSRATPRKLFFLQKLQFRRIYMGKPESRGSSSRTRCGYYTFRGQ